MVAITICSDFEKLRSWHPVPSLHDTSYADLINLKAIPGRYSSLGKENKAQKRIEIKRKKEVICPSSHHLRVYGKFWRYVYL